MIEKTLSTVHPGNIVLHQQYRNSKYQKYSELSEVLYVAEQQNEVLMSNHSTQPPGSVVAVLEAHVAENSLNQKWKGKRGALFNGKGKGEPMGRFEPEKESGDHSGEELGECYRCGAKGHWSRRCRTPNTSLTFTSREKIKGKVNMSPTSSLSLNLRSAMV
jgi:hypothetical protein